MIWWHDLLAKLGVRTETYKIERFKSEHAQYTVIDTHVYEATGEYTEDRDYRIASINGVGVLFAKGKRKAYIAVGSAELEVRVDEYRRRYATSDGRGDPFRFERSFLYRVAFEVTPNESYRIRFHGDKNELQIVCETGEKHKIYTFS